MKKTKKSKGRAKRPGLSARSKNARVKKKRAKLPGPVPGSRRKISLPQSGSADAEGGTPSTAPSILEEATRLGTEAEFQQAGEMPPDPGEDVYL